MVIISSLLFEGIFNPFTPGLSNAEIFTFDLCHVFFVKSFPKLRGSKPLIIDLTSLMRG